MKKNFKIGLILAIVVVLLLALTSTAMAGKRDTFELKFDLVKGTYPYTAEGTFKSTGVVEGEGTAYFYAMPGNIKMPVMRLDFNDELESRIIVNITITTIDSTSDCADIYEGIFRFDPDLGKGDYEGDVGIGEFSLCVNGEDNMTGSLIGKVWEK